MELSNPNSRQTSKKNKGFWSLPLERKDNNLFDQEATGWHSSDCHHLQVLLNMITLKQRPNNIYLLYSQVSVNAKGNDQRSTCLSHAGLFIEKNVQIQETSLLSSDNSST